MTTTTGMTLSSGTTVVSTQADRTHIATYTDDTHTWVSVGEHAPVSHVQSFPEGVSPFVTIVAGNTTVFVGREQVAALIAALAAALVSDSEAGNLMGKVVA